MGISRSKEANPREASSRSGAVCLSWVAKAVITLPLCGALLFIGPFSSLWNRQISRKIIILYKVDLLLPLRLWRLNFRWINGRRRNSRIRSDQLPPEFCPDDSVRRKQGRRDVPSGWFSAAAVATATRRYWLIHFACLGIKIGRKTLKRVVHLCPSSIITCSFSLL